MTGVEPIKVRKHVGWSSASCTPMFETAAILEESVIAACLAFLPAVLEYNAITMNVVLINGQ